MLQLPKAKLGAMNKGASVFFGRKDFFLREGGLDPNIFRTASPERNRVLASAFRKIRLQHALADKCAYDRQRLRKSDQSTQCPDCNILLPLQRAIDRRPDLICSCATLHDRGARDRLRNQIQFQEVGAGQGHDAGERVAAGSPLELPKPNRLLVGHSLQDALALFSCDGMSVV